MKPSKTLSSLLALLLLAGGATATIGVVASTQDAKQEKKDEPAPKPAPKPDEKTGGEKTGGEKTGDAKQGDAKKEEKVVLPKVADGAKAELGKLAPDFVLKDLDGKDATLSQHLGKYVVLEWFNPGCPACKQAYGEGGALRELPDRLKKDGVVWLVMNSEGPKESGSELQRNKDFAKENGIKSPILFDPTGAVGKAYGAKTTPHCFVVSDKGVLIYAGALDNAPYGKVSGDKKIEYVVDAIAQTKAGKKVEVPETKSYG
jgi:peroxiredoxin